MDRVVGPGYLPCPDLDDDGWAEATCGSQDGALGQSSRLGRLPWKTLGLPDLRDGAGERLWYAVSSKHKGLLNCTVSAACLDMGPESALGTITVRDPTGAIVHDGTSADAGRAHAGGAIAVVFAPGAALDRRDASGAAAAQRRDCAGGCDALGRCTLRPPSAVPRCDPRNYLDLAPRGIGSGEDNADFADRNDLAGRPANRNGFIRGPVHHADGALAVNDRLAVIGYDDLQPRLARRVAAEAARCLAAAARAAGGGRFPWAVPLCREPEPEGTPRAGEPGTRFGRLPEPLPGSDRPESECAIGDGAVLGWWAYWRRSVFYAVSPAFDPDSSGAASCAQPEECLALVDEAGTRIAADRRFVLIAAGAPLAAAGQRRDGANAIDAGHWLESGRQGLERLNRASASPPCPGEATRPRCSGASCLGVTVSPRGPRSNDVVVSHP